MCVGPEQSSNSASASSLSTVSTTPNRDMDTLTVQGNNSFSSLLELAADNDVEGFRRLVECGSSTVNEIGLWYGRRKGSKQVVLNHRTPLMVAATFGSVDVVRFILAQDGVDVNLSCGMDKTTALHCAASGGSSEAVDVVRLLLSAGADQNCMDANGCCPVDVIVAHPKLSSMTFALQGLLLNGDPDDEAVLTKPVDCSNLRVSIGTSDSSSPTLSASSENGSPPSSMLVSSLMASKLSSNTEKKEYPFDPSLPDIKNSMYATDEFRMYSFKVRPCSRAYSHDWTECPFVHPGENARRRDPRKFHYSCVPCPEFRKGACRRGDMCEYAHGVFECWLHPAQYRTRLCKDGTSCDRRVCFFAHTPEELRPLYVSTGSAVPSPRSSASGASVMDMAAALSLFPGSPSSISALSPSPFTQPMSPSANGVSHSSPVWQQPNVPMLHLPGSNLQSSRLRSSLSARDIPPEDVNFLPDFDTQQPILNEMTLLSHARNNSPSLSRSGLSKMLTPSNLDELFSSEISSPRYADQAAAVFSPTHKSAIFSQFQQPQSMLSPINTSVFSPKNAELPLLQGSFAIGSPGRMSPRGMDPLSPMSSRLSVLAQREKQFQQLCSLSSRDLMTNNPGASVGSLANSWSNWASPNGKVDWSLNGDELVRFQRSTSFNLTNNVEEPDVSWVHSLVKESPTEPLEKFVSPASGAPHSSEALNPNSQIDSVIESWLEQMQIEQQKQLVV